MSKLVTTHPIGLIVKACKGREDVIQDKIWHPEAKRQEIIRSRKQDDTDGTSNIMLPCPGSLVIFLPLRGDNFTLSFLLRSPYNSGNNRLHTSKNGTFVTKKSSCFDVISTSPVPSNRLLLSHPIKLS